MLRIYSTESKSLSVESAELTANSTHIHFHALALFHTSLRKDIIWFFAHEISHTIEQTFKSYVESTFFF